MIYTDSRNFSITRGRQMNEIVNQSFGLGFENGNSRKNHPCPALLRSYVFPAEKDEL